MKCNVTTIGRDEPFGDKVVVADLDDLGPIRVYEMEFDSVDDILSLLEEDDVNSIEIESEVMSGYDVQLTIFCGEAR